MKNLYKISIGVIAICLLWVLHYTYVTQKNKQYDNYIEILKQTDRVIYTHSSDNFGWRRNTILLPYKTANNTQEISLESSKRLTFLFNYKKTFDSLSAGNTPLKSITKIEYSWEDFKKSEYNFMAEYDFSIPDFNDSNDSADISDKFVFYILDNKYLISDYHKQLEDEFSNVRIYDIKNKAEYFYPEGIKANHPSKASVDEYSIEPRYIMCSDGRLFCIYKYGNRLLCHRLN